MPLALLVLSVVALRSTAAASGLSDAPIAGQGIQYLDGSSWTVTNGSVTVGAMVPGDLLTDLYEGNVIGDPLFGNNLLDDV